MKKDARDIISLHKCKINGSHMIYGSWDINCNRQTFLSCWVFFCSLSPLTARKMEILNKKKKEKTPEDIIILHKCIKNHGYMLYCSWDMVCDRRNCYVSFWTTFCPFTTLTAQKIKISKKKKKMRKTSGDIVILHMCTLKYD